MVLAQTIVELAPHVGISHQHLSEIERGRRNPSPAVFARLCAALGVEDRRDLLAPVEIPA